MVLKPAEDTPLVARLFARMVHEAGFPAGVFNLVTGLGPVAGQALAAHPDVDLVSFTGSTAVGKRIAATAGAAVKRVALELGGKSANVVLPDADLTRAVNVDVANVFANSGQTCSAWTRLLVDADRYEEAVATRRRRPPPSTSRATRPPTGPGSARSSTPAQRDRVRGYIEPGRRRRAPGSSPAAPRPPRAWRRGYYVRPTVFADVTPDMTDRPGGDLRPGAVGHAATPTRRTRCGSPTARSTAWPARSGAPTRSTAVAFARRMDTGQVDINGGRFNPLAPFGGYKQSGDRPRAGAARAGRVPPDQVPPVLTRSVTSPSRGEAAVVRAAVLPAVGAPLEIAEIDLPDPGPGQVRVRLAAAGVCHSDLSLSNGTLRQPVPAVLGHEGAGTVVSVGDGRRPVSPPATAWCSTGRRPAATATSAGSAEPWLCANAAAGGTTPYARRASDGTELYPGLGIAVFAEETVVAANAVLPLPDDVPLADAALLGCAVLTGYGAVHHVGPGAAGRVAWRSSGSAGSASRCSRRPGSPARGRSSRSTSRRRRRSWPGPRARPSS